VRYISLDKLIEVKLASGMSAAHRLMDLADAQSLIGALKLSADFADRLDPSVRDEYRKRWELANVPRQGWEGF